MKKRYAAVLVVLAASTIFMEGCKKETPQNTEAPQTTAAPEQEAAAPEQANTGEALFKQHCAVCHPDGGNIINPNKTLQAKALAAASITKPADIVKTMRNPGPGMTKFDEATVTEGDATAIAEYVLSTFK